MSKEASFYHTAAGGEVICSLCPHGCRIASGRRGKCRQRLNEGGRLVAAGYAACAALALDPVEKKPLYHFYPGTLVVSLGGRGCNLDCRYCQNWEIAQQDGPTRTVTPHQVVNLCREAQRRYGNVTGIAFTYSEPGVWYEYVCDTAHLAWQQGFKTVLVTNGYLNSEPFGELCRVIDAFNIDLKAFSNDFYEQLVGGELSIVLRNIELAVQHKRHVEISYLVVPGYNDSLDEIAAMADWIRGVSPDIALHLNRYFPNYKLQLPPTPLETLKKAYEIARARLAYVYIGNVLLDKGQHTVCPSCGVVVIKRTPLRWVQIIGLTDKGTCKNCGSKLPVKITE